MNKHLNLFYSYSGGAKHEDNVTRSLIITLGQLSPVNLRLFLNDIINRNEIKYNFMSKERLLANDLLGFDIQITDLDAESLNGEESKLTDRNGIILGINWGGKQNLDFKNSEDHGSGGSRPDALIVDKVNDLSVLIESKTSDWLYEDQIKRIRDNFFVSETDVEKIFIEVRWTDIVETLQRISELSKSHVERFLIKQFIEYLDRVGLVDFLEFRLADFSDEDIRNRKLSLFLNQVCNDKKKSLNIQSYQWDDRIYFSDINVPENLYVWLDEAYFAISVVCGAGKKWRCQQLQVMLQNNPSEFHKILLDLQSKLSFLEGIEIKIYTHSKFYISRFRYEWLGDIGIDDFPIQYDQFVSRFIDSKINSFSWMDKNTIEDNFKDFLEGRDLERDENGMFPKWEENEYGQYCNFDIGLHIPIKTVLNIRRIELIDRFEDILTPLKEFLVDFNRVASNQ